MSGSAKPEAWLSPDRGYFVMRRGLCAATLPLADLPRWLAFYRGQRDRKHGAYARFYVYTVRALEALERSLATGP